MAKVSPTRNALNGGEFSALVEGRTDIDRYNASMRKMLNFVPTQQGPAIRRSGTQHVCEVYDSTQHSALIPFVFSDTDSFNLELCHLRIRFVLEGGLQTYDPKTVTNIVATTPLQFDSATLDALPGDQCYINGPGGLQGVQLNITAKVGTVYTVDKNYTGATGAPVGCTASLIYSIDAPYVSNDVRSVRVVQSLDVIYLFCPGYRPRKLARYASFDWRMDFMDFTHGPFMPSDPKNGTLSVLTSGATITGTASSSSDAAGFPASNAFDSTISEYWKAGTQQGGWIELQLAAAKVVDGYCMYMARENTDTVYSALDQAPGDWDLYGSNDGATWFLLDRQVGFVLYDEGRTPLIELNNTTAYSYYRLQVMKCTRNGTQQPSIAELVFRDKSSPDISIVLSGDYSNFNFGNGFIAGDVGRLIRVKGSDNLYRRLKIATVTDATHITATLLDEPFLETGPTLDWQAAYWSDGTGYPTCGMFSEDRLWLDGGIGKPDMVAASIVGAYEKFQTQTPNNTVLDDGAIVAVLNTRRLSGVRWLQSDERGLLVGTGTSEWVISGASADSAITARNIKARESTQRGSATMDPVKIDRQVLFVQNSQRTVREMAYVFQSDGYKTPSMSLFGAHLGVRKFQQGVYTGEPHSIVWYRCADGSLVALTYNRDENVIGWHQHAIGGNGFVESISSAWSSTDLQDTLWLVVLRQIDGQTKRYIERLTRFWDFDSVIADAWFVDCGYKYDGTATDTVTGLSFLEGEAVSGLADGIPFENLTITGGVLTLREPASKVIVGLPYASEGEISRIEAGAADGGTAQGKTKRIHNLTIFLWQSAYGEVGKWNDDIKEVEYVDVEYEEAFDELEPIALQDGMFGPTTMPRGYGKRGSLSFRQTKPLPFNVISLLPQLETQDR